MDGGGPHQHRRDQDRRQVSGSAGLGPGRATLNPDPVFYPHAAALPMGQQPLLLHACVKEIFKENGQESTKLSVGVFLFKTA